MTDLPRNQHIIASGLVAVVGVWITYISYTAQPAAAFLFPRIISTVFVVLASDWNIRDLRADTFEKL